MATLNLEIGLSDGLVEDFEAFAGSLRRELAPAGVLEGFFVDRMILATRQLHDAALAKPASALEFRRVGVREAQAERSLLRSLDFLEVLRARRIRALPASAATDSPSPEEPATDDLADWTSDTAGPDASADDPGDATLGERWQERLIFDAEVSDLSPVVRGTWITAGHVVSLIVDGWSWADILRSHPELAEEDIRACLAYTVEEEDVPNFAAN